MRSIIISIISVLLVFWPDVATSMESYKDIHIGIHEFEKELNIGNGNTILVSFHTSPSSLSKNIQLTCVVLSNQKNLELDENLRRIQFLKKQIFPRFCELITKDNNKYSIGFRKDSRNFRSFTEFTYVPNIYDNCVVILYMDNLESEDGSRVKLVIDTKGFEWLKKAPGK